MKYIILGEDKKEYGPIDGETLRKWVESGRVLAETPVRNAMIKKWGKAQDLEFLAPSLALQAEKIDVTAAIQRKAGHLLVLNDVSQLGADRFYLCFIRLNGDFLRKGAQG